MRQRALSWRVRCILPYRLQPRPHPLSPQPRTTAQASGNARLDSLDPDVLDQLPEAPQGRHITDEHRDTFFMYGGTWVWLNESQFRALPTQTQRALIAERRRTSRPKPSPSWPSQLTQHDLVRWVEAGVRPSRHNDVSESSWAKAADALPNARELAGTFPLKSGPNCFGTVMAAAGVAVAASTWMQPEPFSKWLSTHTTPVNGPGNDLEPGVVLVWHEHGEVAHGVVTMSDGWALNKPSQSWSSPTLVWTVGEVINHWRLPGTQLSRYRIVRSGVSQV